MSEQLKKIVFIGCPDTMDDEEKWLLKQLIIAHHANGIDLAILSPKGAVDDFEDKMNSLLAQLLAEGMREYVLEDREEPFDLQNAFALYAKRAIGRNHPLGPMSVRLELPDYGNEGADSKFDKSVWKSSKIGVQSERILRSFILGVTPSAHANNSNQDQSLEPVSEVTVRSHYDRLNKDLYCVPGAPEVFFGIVRKYAIFQDGAFERLAKQIHTHAPSLREFEANEFASSDKREFWERFYRSVLGCDKHMGHLKFRKEFDAYSPLLTMKYFLLSKIRVLDEIVASSYDDKPRNLKLYDDEALDYALNDEKALREIKGRISCPKCSSGIPHGALERFWIFTLNYLALSRINPDPKLAILMCRILPVFVIEEIELTTIYVWLQMGQQSGVLGVNTDKASLKSDLQIVQDARDELFDVARRRLSAHSNLPPNLKN